MIGQVAAPASGLEAREPPEARGLARDEVRLMVATRSDGRIAHAHFFELPRLLRAGDLVVVNTSATLPAAIAAHRADGSRIELHFATRLDSDRPGGGHEPAGELWVVELRSSGGARPIYDGRPGETLEVSGGARLEIRASYDGGGRLWVGRFAGGLAAGSHLERHGHAIRYGYVRGEWPLSAYQTAYALQPGSAEMPSAGRPLSAAVITALVARGVLVAPLLLHTGVSSPERHERPYPERFEVPEETARLVNADHGWGGRVVAVGTTVVRALETVAAPDGTVARGAGRTELVITPQRGLWAVDGLLTGWHEPEASHMLMLEAAAGRRLLEASYRAAAEHRYRWHEFGDSHLILP